MSLDKHSLLIERTQRSANEFRFGLRAGRVSGRTPAERSVSRKGAQNLVQRCQFFGGDFNAARARLAGWNFIDPSLQTFRPYRESVRVPIHNFSRSLRREANK